MSVTKLVEAQYEFIEKDIKTETDIIVAIAHSFLINRGFRCLGTGYEETLRENEESNSFETLPDNWNENSTLYTLRYVHEQKVYILLGIVANDAIILNLVNRGSGRCTALYIKETVKEMQGNLSTLVPDIEKVLERFDRVFFPTSNEVPVQPSIDFMRGFRAPFVFVGTMVNALMNNIYSVDDLKKNE